MLEKLEDFSAFGVLSRDSLFREMRLRGHYEKPSEKKTREKAEAIRRARKLARKKMQRDGLLPMKPRLVPGASGRGGPARPPPLIEASEFQVARQGRPAAPPN
jgi:small subunit ribosomal protein S21